MPTDPTDTAAQPEEPIFRKKLSDQVFERLWAMIEAGEFAAGDTIPSERALMERFGVGRPAVREALQMLANKGVITISHGERSRVNALTAGAAIEQIEDIAKLLLSSQPSNLEYLKQLRKIVEAGTVAIAAQNRSEADIADLRALAARQRAQVGEEQAFVQTDIAFHVRIAKATGNPLLEAVTQAMLSWLFAYYKPLLRWEGREATTLREHDAIVDFLAAGDAANAARMMEDHLNRSDPLYRQDSGPRGTGV